MKIVTETTRIELTSIEVNAARHESVADIIQDHLISCFMQDVHQLPSRELATPEMVKRLMNVPKQIRIEFYTIMGWMTRTDNLCQDLEGMIDWGLELLSEPIPEAIKTECPVAFPPLVEIEDHAPETPVYLDGEFICKLEDIEY